MYIPELGIQGEDYHLFLCFFIPHTVLPHSFASLLHSLAMMGNVSKRSAVIAVMLTIVLSLFFLFSVSSFHLAPSTDRASSPLSTKTKDFEPKYGCLANTASDITLSKEQWDQCLEPGQEASLYLSIVIVTRIDDYAG